MRTEHTDCVLLDHPLGFPQPDDGYGLGRPPFWDEELGAWVVSRFADVSRVLRDAATFSSQNVLGPRRRAVVSELITQVQDDPRMAAAEPFLHMPGASDGAVHDRERSFFNRAFVPARVRAYEPSIRALVDRLAAGVIGRRDVPFVHEFAVPLTVQVIAEALGLPAEDQAELKRWSDGLEGLTTLDPTQAHVDAFLAATVEFTAYITPLIETRRHEPAGDVISAVAGRNEAGDELTTPEALAMLAALLLAGNETTTAALSGTVLYLARCPDLQDAVRSDPSHIPALVEEGLRLTAPAQALFRTATAHAEVGDVKVAAGDLVFLRYAAANRDAARFEQPLCPRLGRSDPRHLAFGRGPHTCPGAPLARAELQIALEALLGRTSAIRLADRAEPVVPDGGEMTRRVGELYVDLEPA